MNTSYDMSESAILIGKLVNLTRDGRVKWISRKSSVLPDMTRFQTSFDEELEAVIWSTARETGFRIFEKAALGAIDHLRSYESGDPMGNPPINVPAEPAIHRDLIAIAMDHATGAVQGEIYINLMSLLELARRSSDKVEPKIDRVKQYLDKLAV